VLVTNWVVSREAGADDLSPGAARRQSDVEAYREAVTDVYTELASLGESPGTAMAERILARRLTEPEFAIVFSAMPSGPDAAIQRVLREIRIYTKSARSSAANLARMIRIALLSQVDVLWWGNVAPYHSDADVHNAPDLLDLDALRRDGLLLFQYRRQPGSLLARAARSAERLAVPDRTPLTAGLRFACARAELIVLLNQIAADFARLAPAGTPRLWVTSLTRSVTHQRHLRSLGYAALLPSAHCIGYAADIEMYWFRRFQADEALQRLLLDRQQAGEINVIDEGQAWHLCVCPGAGRALRLVPDHQTAG
jgi:Family of unknown function (DUF5715)